MSRTAVAAPVNYINHIAFVLDASGSMGGKEAQVAQVVDQQIAYLAQRSQELDQETRITVYQFDDAVECLIYDKDVLRVPSIRSLYRTDGQTALRDATVQAIDDLQQTATLYGDHSFLIYVITDGAENASRTVRSNTALSARLRALPDHWTLACFVPDATGSHEAKQCGFLPDNISVWDTRSGAGVREVAERIRKTTDAYMQGRAKGVRGYRNLFSPDVANLTAASVKRALDKLHFGQYRLLKAKHDIRIDELVEGATRRPYSLGEGYYQLIKPVTVQAGKKVALMDRTTRDVYVGDNARALIGLPGFEVKLEPADHPKYDIFIQSTSTNRKVFADQQVLVLS